MEISKAKDTARPDFIYYEKRIKKMFQYVRRQFGSPFYARIAYNLKIIVRTARKRGVEKNRTARLGAHFVRIINISGRAEPIHVELSSVFFFFSSNIVRLKKVEGFRQFIHSHAELIKTNVFE